MPLHVLLPLLLAVAPRLPPQWPLAVRERFLARCEGLGVASGTCRCAQRALEQRYTPAQVAELAARLTGSGGDLDTFARLASVAAGCVSPPAAPEKALAPIPGAAAPGGAGSAPTSAWPPLVARGFEEGCHLKGIPAPFCTCLRQRLERRWSARAISSVTLDLLRDDGLAAADKAVLKEAALACLG